MAVEAISASACFPYDVHAASKSHTFVRSQVRQEAVSVDRYGRHTDDVCTSADGGVQLVVIRSANMKRCCRGSYARRASSESSDKRAQDLRRCIAELTTGLYILSTAVSCWILDPIRQHADRSCMQHPTDISSVRQDALGSLLMMPTCQQRWTRCIFRLERRWHSSCNTAILVQTPC